MSIFEIAIAPHRNAMRARYKDRSEKSTNGVGMITPLHFGLCRAAAHSDCCFFLCRVQIFLLTYLQTHSITNTHTNASLLTDMFIYATSV